MEVGGNVFVVFCAPVDTLRRRVDNCMKQLQLCCSVWYCRGRKGWMDDFRPTDLVACSLFYYVQYRLQTWCDAALTLSTIYIHMHTSILDRKTDVRSLPIDDDGRSAVKYVQSRPRWVAMQHRPIIYVGFIITTWFIQSNFYSGVSVVCCSRGPGAAPLLLFNQSLVYNFSCSSVSAVECSDYR
ncbi:unnamed protein product [Ectocarpus sp. 6 AP-2014]